MKRISGYIISLVAIILALPAQAQEDAGAAIPASPADTIIIEPGLRIGFNLVRPLMVFPFPSRYGFESVADLNISPDYFAVAEGGFSRRNLDEPDYHLTERGMFLRIGADRSLYNHLNDVIALGARLGFSVYSREASHIIGRDPYWGSFTGSLPADTFFSQWAEVVLVLKTEVFTNFFLGWNLRGKVLLAGRHDRHMEDRYVPGFGEGTTNSIAGFDFYMYYRIPL